MEPPYGHGRGHSSPMHKSLRFADEIEDAPSQQLISLEDAIRKNDNEAVERLMTLNKNLAEGLIHFEVTENSETFAYQATPLAMAAALDKPHVMEILLKHDSNVYREIPMVGGTALHLAAQFGSPTCVDLLLQKTTRIDRRDNKGYTPFQRATASGRLNNMKLLWDRGPKTQIADQNHYSNQALHLAALTDQHKAIEWLLTNGAEINQLGKHEMTPLHFACQFGSVQAADVLLEHGADIHLVDRFENTPIYIACRYAEVEIYQMLLSSGAFRSTRSITSSTCYHQVVLCKKPYSKAHEAILTSLADYGIDINQTNLEGESPLFLACLRQKTDIVQCLLDLGADVNLAAPPEIPPPLLVACCKPSSKIVEILVNNKADLTKRDHHGHTPLAVACLHGHLEHVRILISNGASVTATDREHMTPLCLATAKQHLHVIFELLATKQYFPSNPAHTRAYMENKKAVVLIEKILQHSVKVDTYTDSKILPTIMFWAIANGRLDLAANCIIHNKEVLEWKQQGASWLHVAAKYERHDCITHLLPHLDVTAENSDGVTALQVAAGNTTAKTSRVLLDMIEAQSVSKKVWRKVLAIIDWDNRGESPLTVATQNKHRAVLEFFWCEIKRLRTIGEDFMTTEPVQAAELLELLAQYEKPGHEDALRQLLECWFPKTSTDHAHLRTTLDWAVHSSQPVVIWWLLAKGGFSSEHIRHAQRLAMKNHTKKGEIILRLLKDPPPSLGQVANPNHDQITPRPTPENIHDDILRSKGSIVDMYLNNDIVTVRYSQSAIREFIYEKGPDSIMKKAGDLHDLELDDLKKRVQELSSQRNPGGVSTSHNLSSQKSKSESIYDSAQQSSKRRAPAQGTLQLRWIHLPKNDLQLMRDLVCRLSHDSKRSEMDHGILMRYFNQSWTELSAGAGQNYMKPQCVHQNFTHFDWMQNNTIKSQEAGARNGCMALYMPYLTVGKPTHHNNKPDAAENDELEESIFSRNSRQVQHIPLSLDQYYYPILTSTEERDNDQVLSKFLRSPKDIKLPSRANTFQEPQQTAVQSITSPGENNQTTSHSDILMVNQLWIWIIDDKTIITATADVPGQTEEQARHRSLSKVVIEKIIQRASKSRFERPTSVHSIVEMILGTATGYFVHKFIPISSREFKGPCEIFRESIRQVADLESSLFQTFLNQLEQMDEEKQRRRKFQSSHEISQIPQNPYHIISDETRLSYQIRDILDELHMLKSIAEDQWVVWKQFFQIGPQKDFFQYYHSYTPEEVKKEIDEMLLEAETAKGSINTLLDLRQKQASIKEAEFSREQANHTAKQSNSLFIFTVITIIFLPLSFLTSLFALDVSSFPHSESGSLKYKSWWLFPILLGVSAAVSIPAITLAWKANDISKLLRTKKDDAAVKEATKTQENSIRRELLQSRWQSIRRRFHKDEEKALPYNTSDEQKD